MKSSFKPFIFVVGPTAVGKTKLGVAIAKTLEGEVISVDSLQCYKPGGIVTAKVQDEEADGITHHLVDYLEAFEEPHDFVAKAIQTMNELGSRGRIPVLVGGSTSLTTPLLLAAIKRGFQPFTILLWSPTASHSIRMNKRVDEMVVRGLLDELKELKELEEQYLDCPNFQRGVWKAIGYQELHPFLESSKRNAYQHSLLEEGLILMKRNTVEYAKFQLDWVEDTLQPLLYQLEAPYMHLRVNGSAGWMDEVEIPAIGMVNQFFKIAEREEKAFFIS
jgi:tRNA A37 N6-isopentenylltransferase MiaA